MNEKPVFELMSREEFFAVDYKNKSYTLQHTHQCNPDYDDYILFEEGVKVDEATEVYQEIMQAFAELVH